MDWSIGAATRKAWTARGDSCWSGCRSCADTCRSGQRRARRGPHAAIPAGVAVVPVQIRAGRAAGASADDAAATGGVCGAERAGDATGKPASGGLDQDFGDVSGSGGGGIHVHSEASELCVGGIGAEGR